MSETPEFKAFPAVVGRRCARALGVAALVAVGALGAACQDGVERRLGEVRALQEIGEVEGALPVLESILAEAPEHPEANYLMGVTKVGLGQPVAAVASLETAAATADDPIAVQAGMVLANVHLRRRAFPEAIAAADRVLQLDPERMPARLLRAEALRGSGDHAEALAEVQSILESDPAQYNAAAMEAATLTKLGRLDEAEASLRRLHELASSGAPSRAANACLAIATFYESQRTNREAARDQALACLEQYPDDRSIIDWVVWIHDTLGETARSDAILAAATDRAPEDLGLWNLRARRAAAAGNPQEGEALLANAAELLDVPGAWGALATFQQSIGRREAATASIERGIASAGTDERTIPAQVALLLAVGRVAEAEAAVAEMAPSAARSFSQARILERKGELEEALVEAERGLEMSPEDASGLRQAGRLAATLGLRKAAADHYANAVRAGVDASDVAAERVRVLMALERYAAAKRIALQSAQHRPDSADLLEMAAEAALAAGEVTEARQLFASLEEQGARVPALLGIAKLIRNAQGPAAAADRIRAEKIDWSDPAMVSLLRAHVDDLANAGQGAAAEALLEAAGDTAPILDLRARLVQGLGREEDARRLLEAATTRQPGYGPAWSAWATLDARAGETEAAIAKYDRAATAAVPDLEAAYYAAQLVLASGDLAAAEPRLRAVVGRDPRHANACNDLAWLLIETDADLIDALYLARRAVRLAPDARTLGTLGRVQEQRNRLKLASAAYERSLELDPDAVWVRAGYARVLKAMGKTDDAVRELRAVAEGEGAEADAARRELAALASGGDASGTSEATGTEE